MSYRKKLKTNLFLKQNYKCWYCGDRTFGRQFEFEHQTPKSQGGKFDKRNIVLACEPCNREKADMNVEEYRKFLASKRRKRVVFYGEK